MVTVPGKSESHFLDNVVVVNVGADVSVTVVVALVKVADNAHKAWKSEFLKTP
jgi:hypothetical protein